MSVPPHPPSGGMPGAHAPDGVLGSPPTPSWTPPWQPAGGTSPAGPALPPTEPRPRTGADRPLVLVLVALASLLVGALGAGIVAMLLFLAGAEDMGRALGEQLARSEDPLTGASGTGSGAVDQFPPAAPGVLGDDDVLDAHSTDCFDGDLQACDTLYFESPPMSDYEEYALTCGGRVKAWAVVSCTELD